MHFDTKPCEVCGSEVELEARTQPVEPASSPAGPVGGVVGGADSTIDVRTCTNPRCATRGSDLEP